MKLQLVKMSLFPDFTFIHPKLYVAELHEYWEDFKTHHFPD